jgi:L-lactate dehydrogenase
LLDRNLAIFRDIVPKVVQHNSEALLLIATNPVDILSYASYKLSGLPSHRVLGSGTILDTARFRYLLGQHFSVDARSVHGLILGEHGDTEVPIWSLANIAGIRLQDYCRLHNISYEQAAFDKIFTDTRDAAYKIIDCKGATYYAVAVGLTQIVESVVRDQKTVLTTSTLLDGAYGLRNLYMSLPTIIGSKGVVQVLTPDLSPDELAKLRHSAEVLRNLIAGHIPT